MARSRNIKPGFFKNEILSRLDPHTRLFFAGLWTVADREGRFEVRLEKIKAEIFPHEQVMLDSCMIHLWDKQFIILYEVAGKRFGQINNWHKHQTPHHKEVPSQIPSCELEKVFSNQEELQAWLMHESCINHSRFKKNASSPLIPDSLNLIPDSRIPDSLIPDAPKKQAAEYTDEFLEAWAIYPCRPGANKKEAFKAWSARLKAGVSASSILDGVRRYSAYCKAQQTDPQFIKQPATFFGPGDHYLSDWTIQSAKSGTRTPKPDNFNEKDYGKGVTLL